MKKKPDPSNKPGGLRQRAEEQYRHQRAHESLPRSEVDLQRLVQELEVHQIELELQNEELKSAQIEIEAGLDRYNDLYNFSQLGYFTLGHEGTILEANLSGAILLGVERGLLVGKRFWQFVVDDDQPVFNNFLKRVFESSTRETCELTLRTANTAKNISPGLQPSGA